MKKIITIAVVFILVISMNLMVSAVYEKCEVHFLNVGQGDCILIKAKGKCFLIDTGAKYYSKKVIKYLDSNNIDEIENIILTHYHSDHYDGMMKISQCKKVGRVYLPTHENPMKYIIMNKLLQMVISIEYIGEGWRLRSQGINLEAVAPLHKDNNIENNNSIVLQGSVGQLNYFFAGDCEKVEEESRLINRGVTVWRTDKQGNIFIKNKVLYCDRNYTSIRLK